MFDDYNKLIISDFNKVNSFANEFQKSFTIDNDILSNITPLPIFHPSLVPPDFSPCTIDTYLLKSNSSVAVGPDYLLGIF